MIASVYRSGGTRLLPGAGQKIKGLVVVPQPVNNNDLWADWPWTTWIQPQIDAAVALGVNCIAMTSAAGQYLAGSVSQAQLASQLKQYLDYVANAGLMMYEGMAVAANWPAQYGYAAIESMWSWWWNIAGNYRNHIGFSCVNEINALDVGLTAQQCSEIMATLVPYARSLHDLPVTASLTLNTYSMLSDASAQAVVPWCDFIDYHPYFNLGGSEPSGEILPANIIPLRQNSWWKPFLVGESGQSVSTGSARQTATWDANRQLIGMQDCLGAMGFACTDYENSQQWGVYAPSSSSVFEPKTARNQCLTPFAAWPNWK